MRQVYALVPVLAYLSAGIVFGAVQDHVSWLQVEVNWDYCEQNNQGDTEYEFNFDIVTDDTVKRVEVLTPGASTFEILDLPNQWDEENRIWTDYGYSEDEGGWEWQYEHTLTDPADLARYGDGWYRVTVIFKTGGWNQTMLWFGVPGTTLPLPQPTQEPTFVNPLPRHSVASPVTFQWFPCTDTNVRFIWLWLEDGSGDGIGCDSPLVPAATTWGPVNLQAGFWDGEISFMNAYHPHAGDQGMVNSDGIPYGVVKISSVHARFAVGRPWVAYQVWAGETDFTAVPDWWKYHYDPGDHGYTLLGESEGETMTFNGQYTYYVILARELVQVDCIRGSDGTYYEGNLTTGNTDMWWNITGPPDFEYASIGGYKDNSGFVRITNPGNWTSIRVILDRGCPIADLTGDCFVNLADLAIMAAQWLAGR